MCYKVKPDGAFFSFSFNWFQGSASKIWQSGDQFTRFRQQWKYRLFCCKVCRVSFPKRKHFTFIITRSFVPAGANSFQSSHHKDARTHAHTHSAITNDSEMQLLLKNINNLGRTSTCSLSATCRLLWGNIEGCEYWKSYWKSILSLILCQD